MPLRLASSYSSCLVLGELPPVRLRAATAAPCLPSAVRFSLDMWEIDFLDSAPARAFLMLLLAAATCLVLAMSALRGGGLAALGAGGLLLSRRAALLAVAAGA